LSPLPSLNLFFISLARSSLVLSSGATSTLSSSLSSFAFFLNKALSPTPPGTNVVKICVLISGLSEIKSLTFLDAAAIPKPAIVIPANSAKGNIRGAANGIG
jgi:hypothetical protein